MSLLRIVAVDVDGVYLPGQVWTGKKKKILMYHGLQNVGLLSTSCYCHVI